MGIKMIVLLVIVLVLGACLCLGGLAVLGLSGYPQPIQDLRDQRALHQLFELPDGLQLVAYAGYPSIVGFGQREGLTLRAVYQVPDRREQAVERWLEAQGFAPLPVPADTAELIRPYLHPDVLEISQGRYLCRTAGNNVLYARETRRCEQVASLNDVIYAAYDPQARRLSLEVSSGY